MNTSATEVKISLPANAPPAFDSHMPKRVFKGASMPIQTSTNNKKKGKGPNGECCNCGGDNCDNKDRKQYSEW